MTNIRYYDNNTKAEFNGRIYYLRKSQGYYYSPKKTESGVKGCDMLHRMVYMSVYGEIPTGYEIHHKDGDKSNNDISNLECLSVEEHREYHATHISEEQRKRKWENLQKNVRPKADIWHGSEKGKEWHRQHYEEMKDKLYEKVERICAVCGKTFYTSRKNTGKFCSAKCAAKDRRDSGIDNIEKICEYCGKPFITNKYQKRQFCSRKCSANARKSEIETRKCKWCGKEFVVKKGKAKDCCSVSCSNRYRAIQTEIRG